jgi:cold shock protein
MSDSNKVYTGTVAWFDPKKGYGFITKEEDDKDIFCHYSDISMDGFKVIMAGDKVTFEENNSFKDKLKAVNITVVERKSGVNSVKKKERLKED